MENADDTRTPYTILQLKPYFVDCCLSVFRVLLCNIYVHHISHISDWLHQWLFAIYTSLFAESELKLMDASQEEYVCVFAVYTASCNFFSLQIDSNDSQHRIFRFMHSKA